ncbi:MAG: copper chaperone PCu(A)C [Paracoccaceae bacterium]
MSFKSTCIAALAATTIAFPVFAGDTTTILIDDPYARVSTASAKSGAAFMMIMNHSDTDDRLIAVSTDVAERAELHTHKEDADGVMQMLHVEEGFSVSAGGMHPLRRGGDHVMLMGLKQSLSHGDMVSVTLTFEKAGDVTVDIPVDLERKPNHSSMDHSGHKSGG